MTFVLHTHEVRDGEAETEPANGHTHPIITAGGVRWTAMRLGHAHRLNPNVVGLTSLPREDTPAEWQEE